MARKAMITIDCERYSKKIIDIIMVLNNSGWTYYKDNKEVRYLPLGDDDDFCWKEDIFSDEEVYDLIENKQARNELIGIDMFWDKMNIGITILARNTREISFNLDINRRTVENSRDSFTDIGWYFSSILQNLKKRGCIIDYICFEEYTN